jgi:hypothetical protein
MCTISKKKKRSQMKETISGRLDHLDSMCERALEYEDQSSNQRMAIHQLSVMASAGIYKTTQQQTPAWGQIMFSEVV